MRKSNASKEQKNDIESNELHHEDALEYVKAILPILLAQLDEKDKFDFFKTFFEKVLKLHELSPNEIAILLDRYHKASAKAQKS